MVCVGTVGLADEVAEYGLLEDPKLQEAQMQTLRWCAGISTQQWLARRRLEVYHRAYYGAHSVCQCRLNMAAVNCSMYPGHAVHFKQFLHCSGLLRPPAAHPALACPAALHHSHRSLAL